MRKMRNILAGIVFWYLVACAITSILMMFFAMFATPKFWGCFILSSFISFFITISGEITVIKTK
tara:strand:+ start:6943 stop:7134 length:192 start_codon:yes stop_codon:yes gene_type:complete